MNENVKTYDGFVLIIDFVDFSLKPAEAQLALVTDLWLFIHKSSDWLIAQENQNKDKTNIEFNSTGDGALIAVEANESNNQYEGFLKFSEKLIKTMKSWDHKAEVRIGIQRGGYFVKISEESPFVHIVGKAPNDCSRIINFGDPGSIIVNSDFVKKWVTVHGDDVYSKFLPEKRIGHIQIFTKHGVPQEILYYRKNRKPPKKIQVLQKVEDDLIEHIDAIYKFFYEEINEIQKISESELACRVSIFTPRKYALNPHSPKIKRNLKCTDFRFIYGGNRKQKDKGTSEYSLDGAPRGPFVQAFKDGKNRTINKLPLYSDDDDLYWKSLNKKFDSTKKSVRGYGRKARTFVVIPFGIDTDPNKLEMDGIICIDSENPLENISSKQLERIGEKIKKNTVKDISYVWRVRAQ